MEGVDLSRPHDQLFRTAFAHPDQARTLLRSRVLRDPRYRALALRLDWSRLERVDEGVADAADRPHTADLLFRIPCGSRAVFLHAVLEHKSGNDRLTAWQMLRYGVRLIDRLHQQLGSPPDLPLVIPLVFHHGEETWTAPLDVRELFAVPEDLTPEERDALRSLLPSWTYLLDDLSREADARIEDARDDLVARIAIEALVHLRGLDAEALPRELLRLRSLLTAVLDAPRGRLLLGMVFSYLATTAKVDTQTVHAAVRKTLPRRTTKLMLNPLEKYVQDKVDAATTKSEARGLRKGKAEGRSRGQLELLRALLQKRFGPLPDHIEERLARAKPAELKSLALRVLDATSLAELFD